MIQFLSRDNGFLRDMEKAKVRETGHFVGCPYYVERAR